MRRSPGQRGPQVISSCLLLSGFIDRRAADQPDANEVFSIIVDYLRHVNRTRKRKRRTVVRRPAVFKATCGSGDDKLLHFATQKLAHFRSEEPSVGKGVVSTVRSRWWPY